MKKIIRIGISACLMGEKVRYNGEHSHDPYLIGTLGNFFEYVPVCPEVECGMSTPRETVRLVGDPEKPRLVTSSTGIDKTDQMMSWIQTKLKQLEKEDLSGFIFKSKSPSSGLYRIKVYGEKGQPILNGVGMFARAFCEHFPRLPVEEEGRLHDIKLRENFLEKIFTLTHWRELIQNEKNLGSLLAFHTRNKLLLLSHNQSQYRLMGKLVATGKQLTVEVLFATYEKMLLKTLDYQTTAKKNINVLLHMVGYFKKQLNKDEKDELIDIIEQYRGGYVPLIVPLTLLKHYARKYQIDYLLNQNYLDPIELKLRAFLYSELK